MAVTRRAGGSVRDVRRSEAEMLTGVREQHRTFKPGTGGDGSVGVGSAACGDLLEGLSPAQRRPHLPTCSWCDYVTVTGCENVPKHFPALNTFPVTIAFVMPYIR